MRRGFLIVGILLAGVLAWWLLGRWVVSGSERFYLLVPPVFLALFLLGAPHGWQRLRTSLRAAVLYLVGLTLFVVLYGLYLSLLVAPTAEVGCWRRLNLYEVLLAVYFLAAIKLLLSVPYSLVRRAVVRLDDRLFGVTTADQPRPRCHGLLPQVLPALLVLPLFLPCILATLYVHRFKVPNLVTPWEEARRPFEDVTFVTADLLTIRGWFIPARRPSDRTLLICHGIGANRSNFLPYLFVGDHLKANVLMFDFRGHGDSDGHTVAFGQHEKLDVLAAVDYLRTQRPAQARTVVGLGISMGTSALIPAAAELDPPFEALIIDSGFTSAVELTDSVLALFPTAIRPCLTATGVPLASLEAGCRLTEVRAIDCIDQVRAPVLFVHARGDEMIPVAHAQRLYDRAQPLKFLWIAETTGHGSAITQMTSYAQAIAQLFPPPTAQP